MTLDELIAWAETEMGGAVPPPAPVGRPVGPGRPARGTPRYPVSPRRLATLFFWSQSHAYNVMRGVLPPSRRMAAECRVLALFRRVADGEEPDDADRAFAAGMAAASPSPAWRGLEARVRSADAAALASIAGPGPVPDAARRYCRWRVHSPDYARGMPGGVRADANRPPNH